MTCTICTKHQAILEHTGEPILERGGLVVTHFPKLETEPTVRGHLLIEPRRHILTLAEMNDEEAGALGVLVRTAEAAMHKVLNIQHVYFFRINDRVPHLHFHLIPRYSDTPREFWGTRIMELPGSPKVHFEEIKDMARRLRHSIVAPA